MEQTIDVPGSSGRGGGRGSPCAASATLEAAESPNDEFFFFSHFSPKEKKGDKWVAVECEPAVALELVRREGL